MSLWADSVASLPVVNVASVPQRSPFRYPGGKTWLIPYLRAWIQSQKRVQNFFEPFAGGAIASLTVAAENLADHVTMSEIDEHVASVWKVVLHGDGKRLAQKIADFTMEEMALDKTLASESNDLVETAFQTILRNRVNHGGILAFGAGRIRNGESGKGLKSRWYPQTLSRRILDIIELREKITFFQEDGFNVIRKNLHQPDALFFLDPPYTAGNKKAGSRLYTHFEINHLQLFSLASQIKGDFLMTYENAPAVKDLAAQFNFETLEIPMRNTRNAPMTELLISSNLAWVSKTFSLS